MSVVIRLSGTGKTHAISYRIVAAEKWSKRDGRNIEILGFYNPWQRDDDRYKIDKARYDHWLSVGAKPSQAVEELVETGGNPKPKPVKVRPKKETAAPAEASVPATEQSPTTEEPVKVDASAPAPTTDQPTDVKPTESSDSSQSSVPPVPPVPSETPAPSEPSQPTPEDTK